MSRPATQDDQDQLQRMTGNGGFGAAPHIIEDIRCVARDPTPPVNARGGRNVACPHTTIHEATVSDKWCNPFGTMHGGCAAWLTDELTCAAVEMLSTPTWWGGELAGGVSLNIDTTYYHPVPVGTKLRIVVTVDRISGTLANARCEFFDADTGTRLVTGMHVIAWRPDKPKRESKM